MKSQSNHAALQMKTSLEVFDDLTLQLSHIDGALDFICRSLPDSEIHVVSTLTLLRHGLEDAKDIANELLERVPS